MTQISAIVPTFNRKAYLLQALESLHAQTRPVHEIIVWDDGSTDGTEDTIRPLVGPGLIYHRAENAGKSAALNKAMTLASGDYIWICDDDDLAVPDAAERLAEVLDRDPTVGVSGGGYHRFRDTEAGHDLSGPGYWPDLSSGSPMRHLLEDIFLFQNATLVRRKCYDQVGPFREDLARSIDYDMIARLATRFPVHMSDEVVFLQRKHDGDRGPAHQRHAASSVDSVWAAQDRVVFEGLRTHIPISLMAAMYDGTSEETQRAAHIQRACIFARHGLWTDACDDLDAAAHLATDLALGPVETGACRRAVSGKHGVGLSADDLRRLSELKRVSPVGRQIVRSLGRGLLWSLRQGVSGGDVRLVTRLGRILMTTGVQNTARDGTSQVQERQTLPLSAYDW